MEPAVKKSKKTVVDVFVEGARDGFRLSSNSMAPNVLFAFVLIQAFSLTGLLDIIGTVCRPIMGVFHLPGIAATVLVAALLSTGGGIGVAVSLFTEGLLNPTDVTILLPAILLMGAQVQYMGRILGTAGVKNKYYPLMLAISILDACLSMLLMQLFI